VSFLLQERGQKEIYQQKYKDKTKKAKTIERAEPNLIETTVRAETYPVKD